MPQFYFHFQQHDVLQQDEVGTELPNTEEAYLEAFQAAREMWAELLQDRTDPTECCFDVRDAHGQPLFVFPFVEVLEACQPRLPINGHRVRFGAPIAQQPIAKTMMTSAAIHARAEICRNDMFVEFGKARARLEDARRLLKKFG